MRSDAATYLGILASVLTRPEWEGFTVIRLRVPSEGGREVSLVDRLVGVDLAGAEGSWFCFEGVEEEHPKFGRQVRVTRGPVPSDNPRVVAGGLLTEDVPLSLVGRVRLAIGPEAMAAEVFAGREDKLAEVAGDQDARRILSAWASFVSKCQLADAARASNLGGIVSIAATKFGVAEVLEDPWILLEIEGADPTRVEKFAAILGGGDDPAGRLRALVLFALRRAAAHGHSHLPLRNLCEIVLNFGDGMEIQQVLEAIAALRQAEVIVLDRDTDPGNPVVYDSRIYRVEQGAAEALASRCRRASSVPVGILECAAADQQDLGLSDDQLAAVQMALVSPVCAITGLPGTGKTTSLRALVDLFGREGRQVLLVAPTGVAARRAQEATRHEAMTVHRALAGRVDAEQRESSYVGVVGTSFRQPGIPDPDGVWGRGSLNPHEAEAVIVDEASMLDEHLFYRILDGTSQDCRLVLVGDPAQLPPVGPGSVLEDLVSGNLIPSVHLTEIFRQAAQSPVIRAAHAVYRGEMPACRSVSAQEAAECREDAFLLVPAYSEEDAYAKILSIAPAVYQSAKTAQVLSPRHNGAAGVTALNVGLREQLNPRQHDRQEAKVGPHSMREGDRIMVIQNNYRHGVFNGEIGEVVRVGGSEVGLIIHGSSPIHLTLDPRELAKLVRLAYAVTVHKSQGLEYDVVILPVLPSFGSQLTRRLFYTAITRARRVILVGMESAVADAVRRDGGEARFGLLEARIRKLLGMPRSC